ncbi:MAG TPA: hypothetical protein VHT24_06470 [Pseudacidobacterium sp.]|nr:hypothetical protein [Pseudacidobacterium sp.]
MKWIVASSSFALLLFTTFLAAGKAKPSGPSGSTAQETESQPAEPAGWTATQKANITEYVVLLHEDVPDQKEQLMGSTLQLSEADAAKFWPLYDQYSKELRALNEQAAKATNDFVSSSQLNDQTADGIVHASTQFQTQRAALMDKYYGQVKEALGAETAARFFEVESQLVALTDLQRSSSLTVPE